MRLFAAALAGAGMFLAPAEAQEMGAVEIKEWEVPWEGTRPRDPFAASADSVWFQGQTGHYIAHLKPSTGEMERIDLEPGAGPHNLIVSKDGRVWIAGNRIGSIDVYDPKAKSFHKIPMPEPEAKDPHTLIFNEDESEIYFTLQGSNMIGKLDTETEEVSLVRVHTPRSRPYGINQAPDGSVWVALFAQPKLLKVDPETMVLTEITLPRPETRSRRLEITSDGRIWYADYRGGKLGVFNPQDNKIREWLLPGGESSRPYGMEVDGQDRLWIVETGGDPDRFIGFDTNTETFFSRTEVASRVIRHMHYHEPSGTVWFGTDANTVGRAKVE